MLAHNLPRTPDGKLPPPIFTSCSGGFFPGLKCNETDELRFIEAFTKAGIKLDYWWMDAGWYPCGEGWPQVGTWTPESSRFPRGLKAVSDQAHAHGIGLIVWFEPERVTPGTWLWMAWQFDLPETGQGMVQVFRRERSPYEMARFKLRSLDANKRYTVTDLDDGQRREFSGQELCEQGLRVTLPVNPAAAILLYARATAKP